MSSKKLSYSSMGKTIDGTTYCSAVETLAENILEDSEEDATIVSPSKTGWASLRSTAYTMNTDNAEAHLPLPIYKIKKVWIKLSEITFQKLGLDSFHFSSKEFSSYYGKPLDALDITEYVVPSLEWQTLTIAKNKVVNDYQNYVLGGKYKDNTFQWEEGSDTIPFLGKVYKRGVEFFDGDTTPTFERLARSIIYKIGADYTDNWGLGYTLRDMAKKDVDWTFEVRDWLFRIEYVPMTSKTKIRARKNAPTKEEYIQPYNQRAEINAASALGKSMWLTAQKTGCNEIAVVKNYTSLADIPPLGALVKHNGKKYRLVANHYVQTNTVYMQVTHTLSENWSEKSKHIAVDQKYRNWAIPQDILWRNLYWEDFLRIGQSKKEKVDLNIDGGIPLEYILKIFNDSSSDDQVIDSFTWRIKEVTQDTNGKFCGARLPCSTYGIANSMIFSASFKDNLSAGLCRNGNLCEEVLYCEPDGTLENVTIQLGNGNAREELDDYPGMKVGELYSDGEIKYSASNRISNVLFDKTFNIHKDPGEAIKFTYQIHTIGEDGIVIGKKFSECNPLIKDWKGETRKFNFYKLKYYVPEGTDVLKLVENGYESVVYEDYFSELFTVKKVELDEVDTEYYGETYEGTFTDVIKYMGSDYKAWAITDDKLNLYIACNDPARDKAGALTPIYFQLHHKR